jgi:uncharacterized membrane protein
MATADAAISPMKDAEYVRRKEDTTRAKQTQGVNVSFAERVVSGVVGGVLITAALKRRGLDGLAMAGLGAALGYRAFSGHCHLYQMLGIDTAITEREQLQRDATPYGVPAHAGVRIEESIQINRPAEELYAFWRNHDNLAKFMPHIESVTSTDGIHSHWVMKGPAGVTVQWDARIHHDDPWRALSWASVDGQVDTAGSVHFKTIPDGGGSEVRLNMKFDPPMGKLGVNLAKLLGMNPDGLARETLLRFKQVMESSE